MSRQQVTKTLTWVWLPVFLALCFAVGSYRSLTNAHISANTCAPQSSQVQKFIGCR